MGTMWEEWQKYTFPVALGFVCLGGVQLRRIYNRPRPQPIEGASGADSGADSASGIAGGAGSLSVLHDLALGLVQHGPPYRFMSNMWGKLTNVELPFSWARVAVYRAWTYLYDCKLDEMRHPLSSYPSLAAFFLRPLKDGVRMVDADSPGVVASPTDAKVLHVGTVDMRGDCEAACRIEQVKGVDYLLRDFVGRFPDGLRSDSSPSAASSSASGRKLQTVVLYLAPGDYHHFHSPVQWTISQRRHFPGRLLPVRPWAVERVQDLYARNERVVLNGEWEHGFFSFGAVGALNVGSIDIVFDEDLRTNQDASYPYQSPPTADKAAERMYPAPVNAVAGQPLGSFRLGSTVVLVFETSDAFAFSVKPGDTVQVGQRLGSEQPRASVRPATACPPWPGEATNAMAVEDMRRLRKAQ